MKDKKKNEKWKLGKREVDSMRIIGRDEQMVEKQQQEILVDTKRNIFGVEVVDHVDTMDQEIDGYVPTVGTRFIRVTKKLVAEGYYRTRPAIRSPRMKNIFRKEL